MLLDSSLVEYTVFILAGGSMLLILAITLSDGEMARWKFLAIISVRP